MSYIFHSCSRSEVAEVGWTSFDIHARVDPKEQILGLILPMGFQEQPAHRAKKHPISADMVATARTKTLILTFPACPAGVQQPFVQLRATSF